MSLRTIPEDINKGGKFRATASGTLPNGKPVIVNSDGTVSVVEETAITQAVGTSVIFENARSDRVSAVYDAASGKVVIAYSDYANNEYGTAIVGTVSDTTITFGTPVVFESAITDRIGTAYDAAAQKVVICYKDAGNSDRATAIVGTVSGTSISFGTAVVVSGQDADEYAPVYDTVNQKIVLAVRETTSANWGRAYVGTVSGTSISFGSATTFESAAVEYVRAAYDIASGNIIITYADVGNSNYGTAVVGTVSGTSISFGTPVVFKSASTREPTPVYDPDQQKIVVVYRVTAGEAIVGTVSGTSITFGTPVQFFSSVQSNFGVVYDPVAQKTVIVYVENVGTDTKVISGTVSGTSISFGSAATFKSGKSTTYLSSVYDVNNSRVVTAYRDSDNSNLGTATVFRSAYTETNLTSENYIGISTGGNVADTANATVDIIGTINEEQSGLTPGQSYYVQTDGTLSTTPDDPSVFAGTAISATSLVVKT